MIKLTERATSRLTFGSIRTKIGEPLGASRFNHDTPMAVLNWQADGISPSGERLREASS